MYLVGTPSPSGLGQTTNLGFFRPNQAIDRWIYAPRPRLAGLGQGVAVDPTLLLGGIVALGAAMFLLGSKKGPVLRARRRARLQRKLAALGPA